MGDPPIEELGAAMAVGEVLFVVVVGGCLWTGVVYILYLVRHLSSKNDDETQSGLARLQKLGGGILYMGSLLRNEVKSKAWSASRDSLCGLHCWRRDLRAAVGVGLPSVGFDFGNSRGAAGHIWIR
jgi:hypothetical protein